MGWRDRQRQHRKHFDAQTWGQRIREAWNHLPATDKADFLAELEAKASTAAASRVFRNMREAAEAAAPPVEEIRPEPENPAYNAAVAALGGDPLHRAAYTPSQLIPIYAPQGGDQQ